MRTVKVAEKQTQTKKIRKGDTVVVIAGNDRGQVGVVQQCNGNRVHVQGVNIRKKHVKRSEAAPKGRIVEMECAIDISNVKIWDGSKGVKLRVRTNEQGERQFVYKNGDEEAVYRSVKKPK